MKYTYFPNTFIRFTIEVLKRTSWFMPIKIKHDNIELCCQREESRQDVVSALILLKMIIIQQMLSLSRICLKGVGKNFKKNLKIVFLIFMPLI